MSTVTPKLTHENLNSYEVKVKGAGKEITYTDKVTNETGTNTVYDLGMTKDGVDSALLFRGGDMTQASKENPYKNCLRAFLIENKGKWVSKKGKDGKIEKDDQGKNKLINLNAPYTMMISERTLGGDPEFDAFDKFTREVKKKILNGFMKNPNAYSGSYKTDYDTVENLGKYGCRFNYCRHPNKKDGNGKPIRNNPDTSKPKYCAFNVYENTSIAYPVEKTDENGNVMHDKNGEALVTRQEIPKKKLLNSGVVFYGWPVAKTNRIGKGSTLYLKSYLDSFVVFDLKVEKRENDHSDMLKSGYKSKIVNPDIAKAISGIKIDFGGKTDTKSTDTKPTDTKSKLENTKPESKGPTTGGELTKVKPEPDVMPKTSPKVNLEGLDVLKGLTEHD